MKAVGAGEGAGPADVVRRDERSPPERWLRDAWREGPGAGLRLASGIYRLGVEARNALWELGVARPVRASIPVVSVGGLSVGGTGKTPLTAEIARQLGRSAAVAVVTHGFPDEMRVHRELNPDVVVAGSTDRVTAVEAAAAAGADVAVVDGGFQHRRLWRDADVVTVSASRPGSRGAVLPAGPYREGGSALRRADALVVVRRRAPEVRARRTADGLEAELRAAVVARCAVRPAGLRPANERARREDRCDPAVAVASIMYPEVFLAQLRETGGDPDTELVLPDHGGVDADLAAWLEAAAGDRGVVGTLKDVVKLRQALPDSVPLWCLDETVVWEAGRRRLVRRLARLVDRRPVDEPGRRSRPRGTGPRSRPEANP